ncbi:MAG: pseudouridine synthase [Anaerolineae bacterium]|nr:pseudouridine synthase [Anaerolineae bacterium]MBN8621438.1 pseudouridine synthase [Anaerolineae bacterium]
MNQGKRVIRLWKPYGVLTQFTDAEGRPTLADYVRVPGVYAAGRLDMDSEGLLLLTDDNRLKTRLMEPKFGHPRTYWAQVEGIPDEAALERLRKGVQLKDGWTRPALAERIDPPKLPAREPPIRVRKQIPDCWVQLTLTEGRNRQVRRMTAAVGYPTLRLVRWAIGMITLEGLKPGEWQVVEKADVERLMGMIGHKG